jgi:CheY-like chemotaxis protein
MAEHNRSAPCVLIVEDEVLVRMFAVDALEDAGFLTVQAASGAEALVALQSHELTAVIIDLGLPDRPGDEVAAEVRERHSDLPIIIASGRSERELKDRFAADPCIAILAKPYTEPMLLGALQRLGVSNSR